MKHLFPGITLCILLLSFNQCSDDTDVEIPKRTFLDTAEYSGIYEISPSLDATLELHSDGSVIWHENGKSVKGRYIVDEYILQIHLPDQSGPTATFAVATYNEESWPGLIKGETKFLTLQK